MFNTNKKQNPFEGYTNFLPPAIEFHPDKCLIDAAIQNEIDRGVPEWRRTKAWYISCPCKKCSPFYL